MNNIIVKEATIKAVAIEESISNMAKADENMTLALIALEAKNYGIAAHRAQDVLTTSECIEQRLAALCIQDLAFKADKDRVRETLTIAYDTDHQLDPVAKIHKSCKKLEEAVDDSFKKLKKPIGEYFAWFKAKK